MNKNKLPIALAHEPLVEALFEVRLTAGPVSLADILPGFLIHQLKLKPNLIRLPTAEIPFPIRAADPNLPFQGLIRLDTENYLIGMGDRSFAVVARMPYRKWLNFKSQIVGVVDAITKVGIDNKVERFSLKYTNLISGNSVAEQLNRIKISIDIGSVHVDNNPVNLQVHNVCGDVTHIITVGTGAEIVTLDGTRMSGTLLDIDSIKTLQSTPFASFADVLACEIDPLRQANKELFFGCISDSALSEFGPVYE